MLLWNSEFGTFRSTLTVYLTKWEWWKINRLWAFFPPVFLYSFLQCVWFCVYILTGPHRFILLRLPELLMPMMPSSPMYSSTLLPMLIESLAVAWMRVLHLTGDNYIRLLDLVWQDERLQPPMTQVVKPLCFTLGLGQRDQRRSVSFTSPTIYWKKIGRMENCSISASRHLLRPHGCVWCLIAMNDDVESTGMCEFRSI